tara:strand:+ start:294 stop:416 length:123 start_codon:yes stop_codon:yes gene_type:complete
LGWDWEMGAEIGKEEVVVTCVSLRLDVGLMLVLVLGEREA